MSARCWLRVCGGLGGFCGSNPISATLCSCKPKLPSRLCAPQIELVHFAASWHSRLSGKLPGSSLKAVANIGAQLSPHASVEVKCAEIQASYDEMKEQGGVMAPS